MIPFDRQPTFKKAQILAIAKKHKFENPDLIDDFDGHMRYAAGVYFNAAEYLEIRPTRKKVLDDFATFDKNLQSLKRKLQKLLADKHAARIFHSIARDLEWEIENKAAGHLPNNEKTFLENIGFGFVRKISDEQTMYDARGITDVYAALEYLSFISKQAPQLTMKDKKGNPGSLPLVMWAEKMSYFWTSKLGRKFKVDYSGKDLISPAGAFLTDCLKIVDPKAIPDLTGAVRRVQRSLAKNRK